MYFTKQTITRPDTNSVWWFNAPELATITEIFTTADAAPAIQSLTKTESPDGLTFIREASFIDQAAYDVWKSELRNQVADIFEQRVTYAVDKNQAIKLELKDGEGPWAELYSF